MAISAGPTCFLFTDIEGSTRLWEAHSGAMHAALLQHDQLLRSACECRRGRVFKTVGDAFCVAFESAAAALSAAVASQRALGAAVWPPEINALRVRMALHAGDAYERDGDYFGPALNRVARLLAAAHGEQILISSAFRDCFPDLDIPGISLLDLGSHRLRDLQQPERIFQVLCPDLPTEFPPPRTLDSFSTNLPVQLTSFIGRESEIEEVKALLSTSRLLSLTGSGGCGKTRLALQVAADVVELYSDGVWLVDLAPISDPDLVPQAAAMACGIREAPGRPLRTTLLDAMRTRHLLLILDNCEHLIDACAQLAKDLLSVAPNVTLLATSREPLAITGEQHYRVPSLSAPQPKDRLTPAAMERYEAVRLFLDRACLHEPDFQLTPANAPALVSVCHRLDGIPLAIELAAVRVRSLSVEEINSRLDNRFRLLTGGARTALPRQQTLRALVDWSYELLSPQERLLLQRLAVFSGGWTLEAAELVCSDNGMEPDEASETSSADTLEKWEVLDLLASLTDKSLVVANRSDSATRYRLLETVRHYAWERLQQSGEAQPLRRRHLRYFLKFSGEARQALIGPSAADWLARVDRDHDNVRAALDFSLQVPSDVAAALRLAQSTGGYWLTRGYLAEGSSWLQRALNCDAPPSLLPERMRALNEAGNLASTAGSYDAARQCYAEALQIATELGDQQFLCNSLGNLGRVAYLTGDFEAALQLFGRSLAGRREMGDRAAVALSLNNMANVLRELGRRAEARAKYQEALEIWTHAGDERSAAYALRNLAGMARSDGDLTTSKELVQRSLVIRQRLNDRRGLAYLFGELAHIAEDEADLCAARDHASQFHAIATEVGDRLAVAESLLLLAQLETREDPRADVTARYSAALNLLREIGDYLSLTSVLVTLSIAAAERGESDRAAKLLGAAQSLRSEHKVWLREEDRQNEKLAIRLISEAIGPEALQAAVGEELGATIEHAIDLALGHRARSAD